MGTFRDGAAGVLGGRSLSLTRLCVYLKVVSVTVSCCLL